MTSFLPLMSSKSSPLVVRAQEDDDNVPGSPLKLKDPTTAKSKLEYDTNVSGSPLKLAATVGKKLLASTFIKKSGGAGGKGGGEQENTNYQHQVLNDSGYNSEECDADTAEESHESSFTGSSGVLMNCSSEGKGPFAYLCDKLRDNDPDTCVVNIGDASFNKSVELGMSLTYNTVVNKVIIDLAYFRKNLGAMDVFLGFLKDSPSLKIVELLNCHLGYEKTCNAITLVLRAVSKNTNVQEVTFDSEGTDMDATKALLQNLGGFAGALSGGIRKPTPAQLSSLSLSCCQCKFENLELLDMPESFVCQLLPDLSRVNSLLSVALMPKEYSVDTFVALSALLTKTDSLQHFELCGYNLTHRRFEPVEVGMANNATVRAVTIRACWLNYGATELFQSMFGYKGTKLAKLTIGKNVKFYHPTGTVVANILKKDTSQLTEIDLNESELPPKDFIDLLQTLGDLVEEEDEEGNETKGEGIQSAKKRLERLHLGAVSDVNVVDALQETMPKMYGLKYVSIKLEDQAIGRKEDLIEAFKSNATLERCTIDKEDITLQQQKPKKRKDAEKSKRKEAKIGKRRESLRRVLSDEQIELINAKDEFLQRDAENKNNGTGPEEDETAVNKETEAAGGAEKNGKTKRRSSKKSKKSDKVAKGLKKKGSSRKNKGLEEAVNRHQEVLGDNVRKLLAEEERGD